MKSKIHACAETAWSCLVIMVTAVLFLFMVFAWAIIPILAVAKSASALLLAPLWVFDICALKKILAYAERKWGANDGSV